MGGTSEKTIVCDEEVNLFEVIKGECHGLVKRNDAKSAMEKIQQCCAKSTSKEEEFKWRLIQCEIALAASKPQMALALIDELESSIKRYALDEWRPDLAAMVYEKLLQSFNRSELEKERFDRIYEKLCCIDPVAAMEIKLH